MKSIFCICIFLTLLFAVHAQPAVEIHPGKAGTKIKPYVTLKLEVYGVANILAHHPIMFFGGYGAPQRPGWFMPTVEIGIGKRSALIAGIGGRYKHYDWREENGSAHFSDNTMGSVKGLVGFRRYLTLGLGQGFYLQPTGKFVWQGHRILHNLEEGITDTLKIARQDHDFIVSLRFGWQMPICKRLHVDVAVGPGIGIRADRYNSYDWNYYWHMRGISEIDLFDIYLTGNWWTDFYLIGDASLALAWKFCGKL